MKTKTENLKAAYKAIREGKTIICNNVKIWIAESRHGNRKYIFWYGYGSSAERLGIDNLRWIMNKIAESDDYAFSIAA